MTSSLLLSKKPPVILGGFTFAEQFFSLADQSDAIDIFTGYISSESVFELAEYICSKGAPITNLMIGMHQFFTFLRISKIAKKLHLGLACSI